jgi:mannose-1-phosphate guanylyltransferase
VFPADFGWSDLGTWGSLQTLSKKDDEGNAIISQNVRLFESSNCIVNVEGAKQVAIQGLDGYIVAERDGRLLICKLADEQRIKEFSK